ncbi:MAG: flagellar hook-basal body complex protein FliE [Candidatus Cloacimonadota bacterium]|nr:flagellar hook-basal body complex protein FliE [Candidatus Cloacimonadota bacterium]
MNINGISGINQKGIKPIQSIAGKKNTSFLQIIKNQLEDVNKMQLDANQKINEFATGDVKNVHDVMIAMEKADISFNLMVEIRNKLVESYKEIMRMQV